LDQAFDAVIVEILPEMLELFGNFPQAVSHIGLVNAAWAISQTTEKAQAKVGAMPLASGMSPSIPFRRKGDNLLSVCSDNSGLKNSRAHLVTKMPAANPTRASVVRQHMRRMIIYGIAPSQT
jgi:hypothetical protein